MLRNVSLLLLAVVVLAGQSAAGEAEKVFTDPAKAGPDFAIQGEYSGTIQTSEGDLKVGVQVVALGDGKFDAVAYIGGLPGDGWTGEEKGKAHGQRSDGVVTFTAADGGGSGVLADGVITIKDGDGNKLGTLKKVERKSPTLGAKPPEGAVVLFDGTSPDKFEGGRMTDDGLLMEGATSKQRFGSFTIHLEFRTPFQPYARGQARGNSGFYAQGRHEVQILDSFGLEGESNECGGIYGVSRPKVNMCFPPLAWQTYDIDYTAAEFQDGKLVKNARMTVRHNGVLIQENIEIPEPTTAAPVRDKSPAPGPVFLQDHGCPVRFRNIWVVEKK